MGEGLGGGGGFFPPDSSGGGALGGYQPASSGTDDKVRYAIEVTEMCLQNISQKE